VKVGLIMMALALVIAAVVVSVTLRSDPGRLIAAEVATKSPGEAPRCSSQASLPCSQSAQRNVYLARHRMGFRGSWSRMIFYNLHKLDTEGTPQRPGRGRSYRSFASLPDESWGNSTRAGLENDLRNGCRNARETAVL
jgi:hypothetical protein